MTRRDGWFTDYNGDHEYVVDGQVKARMYVTRMSLTDRRVDYYTIVIYGKESWDWHHIPPVHKWQAGRREVLRELKRLAQ